MSSPPLVANKVAGTFTVTATTAGSNRPARFTLTNRAGNANAVAVGAASGESTVVGTRFPIPLAVTVADQDGNPVAGATVVFGAPLRGPGGSFLTHRSHRRVVRVATGADGIAVAPPFVANARVGGYVVTARVKGSTVRAAFALVNERR